MAYTTFSQNKNNQLLEPMFFGQSVNVARFDQQKYDIFEKLIEKQLSFFWRPEEVDVSRDRIDYQALPEHEKHIFISNLKYQTLLDSIQGRSPNVALLPLISIPELETWIETWAFSETIHSRSYTHIIRNIVNDPALVFDDIVTNEQILSRAKDISGYYDDLIEMTSYWPVSYTHLDVYKRQIVNDPALVFDDIVTNEQILSRAKDISGYYDDLIEMTSYWPVSYTHLDVYKRQDISGYYDALIEMTSYWPVSYTHLDVYKRQEQILSRAKDLSGYYDDLIEMTSYWHLLGEGTHQVNGKTVTVNLRALKKQLYLCLMSVNALEAIRFYVSFACSFAFAERELMEGNAKIIKLIARDEALHLTGTQHMLNLLRSGVDDPEMAEIAKECRQECYDLFVLAAEQEKEWAEYLFSGGSMIGLNKDILWQYIEYITNIRMNAVGLDLPFKTRSNPIPWINSWLVSDNVQVAPQEVEVSSYLVGQIDSEVNADDLSDFQL